MIDTYNKQNTNKIKEFNWYITKPAKVYGYITVFITILWTVLMLVYPEKLKVSNIGLFLVVLTGVIPIVYRIFKKVEP